MESKENIVFLGMMGSGKTSIGKLISKKLELKFYDIDEQVEKTLGMKISKIFETRGEKFFREQEERITLNILKKRNTIISLGGGSFLNKNIRHEILENHKSFWLKWDTETLIKRIGKSKKRPLAYNSSKTEMIQIIKERSNVYSKALYSVNCNGLTKNQIVEKIINTYETN